MIKIFLSALFFGSTVFAALPPTSSKLSSDPNNVTTFNFQFPNFTGTHTGTTVSLGVNGIAGGGTGQATKAAAFDALSPMTTGGDLIYGGASGAGTRLANGSNGQYLTSSGGTAAPTWTTGLSNPLTTTGDIIYGVGSTPTRLAAGTSGGILQTLGSALAPAWTALSSIAGSVTTNSTSAYQLEMAYYSNCTASPCTQTQATSSWITSATRSSAGAYIVNFPTKTILPFCFVQSTSAINVNCETNGVTTSLLGIACRNSAGTYADNSFIVSCFMQR